jgi:glycosyltransferase involved in cell wall biosynthesis
LAQPFVDTKSSPPRKDRTATSGKVEIGQISRTKYPDRIHVIPNPNTFAVPFTHERLKQKKNTVLIVSRLDEPQKRISLALMAWRYVMLVGGLSDWTLKIVGEGNYGDDYSELVKKKNIQNVQFIGHSDPEAFYEEASLYLHSAKREGWGLTITEAMQKGVVPIVMNSSPVFEELIMHNESGILSKDGDVKLFALHIIELMNNRNKREKMAVRSIETTQKNEIELIVKKWCAVIMNFNLNTHTNDL